MSMLYQDQHCDLSAQLRQKLVASMMQMGALQSPAIQQAFLTIPREAFVLSFYDQEMATRKMVWRLVDADQMPAEDYLALVYRDEPLITQLDERGWPTSSSSMPSAMARMLEALDIRPGQRVLEIGTGTGYNAALLTHLVGDSPSITTIELDPVLAERAARALQRIVGQRARVLLENGLAGYRRSAPYDRIIITASSPTLPMTWLEQLRPGGKLVMDLQGSLESGFLVVEKAREGVTGRFLEPPLHFMPLIMTGKSISHRPGSGVKNLLQGPSLDSFELQDDDGLLAALANPAFRWFVQWRLPGCQITRQKQIREGVEIHSLLVRDAGDRALVRLQRREGDTMWRGNVYGSLQFWHHLQGAHADFLSLGEPRQDMYALVVGKEGPALAVGGIELSLQEEVSRQ